MKAEILPHPQSEEKFNEWVREFAYGNVKIERPDGQPLSAERALFMLETAKLDVIARGVSES